jgi:hypothetical protein
MVPKQRRDDGYRWLLRARCERPRRRAAERGQEFSSSDVACHLTLRLGVIHAMEGSYHASIARSVITSRSGAPCGGADCLVPVTVGPFASCDLR